VQRKPEDPRPVPKPLVVDPPRVGRPYTPASWIEAMQMTSNRPSDDFWGCIE
jgi:hypothetical protein